MCSWTIEDLQQTSTCQSTAYLPEQYRNIDSCSRIWINVVQCDIQMKQMSPKIPRTVNKDNAAAAKSLQNKMHSTEVTRIYT